MTVAADGQIVIRSSQSAVDISLGRVRHSRIPPTQLVDCSYSAYTGRTNDCSPNPINAVGGIEKCTQRSVRLRPSADGSGTPSSAASVGAMSRMSICPRSRPAATPGPAMKNEEFISGTSGA